MDMFLITKILDLAYVRCRSHNKSDTKLFRVYSSLSLRLRYLRERAKREPVVS